MTTTAVPVEATATATTAATVAASPAPIQSMQFTRAQVTAAVSAAGNHPNATDSDIRRLVTLQFHMIAHRLDTIDTETLGDDPTGKLLDFFVPRS
ncbi:hypothetical protein [Variovorax sp. KK3]|uniref:hypothetical protein n=1 Tax=Variovorax sp. KK3 TaxID=1855728 RepID=UPI00117EFD10|nr:hypothetical protein [Variovorax sp. KK3]